LILADISLIYERPIRKYFEDLFGGRTSTPEVAMAGRRRLLNEPFFLILIDFSMWVTAAIVYPMAAWGAGAGAKRSRKAILSETVPRHLPLSSIKRKRNEITGGICNLKG
jgi:hypothetical protein